MSLIVLLLATPSAAAYCVNDDKPCLDTGGLYTDIPQQCWQNATPELAIACLNTFEDGKPRNASWLVCGEKKFATYHFGSDEDALEIPAGTCERVLSWHQHDHMSTAAWHSDMTEEQALMFERTWTLVQIKDYEKTLTSLKRSLEEMAPKPTASNASDQAGAASDSQLIANIYDQTNAPLSIRLSVLIESLNPDKARLNAGVLQNLGFKHGDADHLSSYFLDVRDQIETESYQTVHGILCQRKSKLDSEALVTIYNEIDYVREGVYAKYVSIVSADLAAMGYLNFKAQLNKVRGFTVMYRNQREVWKDREDEFADALNQYCSLIEGYL